MSTQLTQLGINVDAIARSMVDRGDAVLAFDWVSHGAGITQEVYEFCHEGFRPPMDFIARSLHCGYGTMEADDRERFREAYTIEFQILQKIMYRAPLSAIPFHGVLFPALNAPEGVQQAGTLTMPRYIPPMAEFRIRLVGRPIAVSSLRFLPFLNGLMDRAIQ
jgi:hypothetical protein